MTVRVAKLLSLLSVVALTACPSSTSTPPDTGLDVPATDKCTYNCPDDAIDKPDPGVKDTCEDGSCIIGDDWEMDGESEEEPPTSQQCAAGQVLITEVMYSPAGAYQTAEWFELHNPTDTPCDLIGCVVKNNTKTSDPFAQAEPLILQPKDYMLFAKSADPAASSGLTDVDYVYTKVTFSDGGDSVRISCSNVEIAAVAYSSGKCQMGKKPTTGIRRSMSLDPTCLDVAKYSLASSWCNGSELYSYQTLQNLGSPGKANPSCAKTSCGDECKQEWEICDDGNTKEGDGCENDCTESPDTDGDKVYDAVDNCPKNPNPDQTDTDGDGMGDACDPAVCGNKKVEPPGEECDDGNKNECDGCGKCKINLDSDNDTVLDCKDNCKDTPNPDQADLDKDGKGDLCDPPECGNGFKEGDEECDNGPTSCDGCSASCKPEAFVEGSVIVTEIMYDPKPSNGEYVELYNTTDQPIDIAGCKLTDEGSATTTISPEPYSALVIPAKSYMVLAKSADIEVNCGIDNVEWAWGSGFPMSAPPDKVVLTWTNLDKSVGVFDKVTYSVEKGFPATKDQSLNLNPDKFDSVSNDDGVNWCPSAATALPCGEFGTPGEPNEKCSSSSTVP